MITERTLKRWRRDALTLKVNYDLAGRLKDTNKVPPEYSKWVDEMIQELSERVLRLTQELMDLALIKK